MMKVLCTSAANCESGATGMEYALTAAIISMLLLTGADTVGEMVNGQLLSLSKKLEIASEDQGQMLGGTSLVSMTYPTEAQSFGSISTASSTSQP